MRSPISLNKRSRCHFLEDLLEENQEKLLTKLVSLHIVVQDVAKYHLQELVVFWLKHEKVSVLVLENKLILWLQPFSSLCDEIKDSLLIDFAVTNLKGVPTLQICWIIRLEVHIEESKMRLLKAVLFSVLIFPKSRE